MCPATTSDEAPGRPVRPTVSETKSRGPGKVAAFCILAGAALAPGSSTPAAARELAVAAGGEASLPIVIHAEATDGTRQVAADLGDCLRRITGARFDVREGAGERGIVLGTLAQFPDPRLAEALAIRRGVDGREAFAIRTGPGRLRLIGATELGASHAAYRFLEHLGCRWYFPAAEWEILPSRPTLTVELNETDRPRILSRRIWWGYGFFDKKCRIDYETWARRNRMASSRGIRCGHAWQSIIIAQSKTFDAHPEYLALVDGERRGPQLCVSNPAVREIAVRWAVEQLRRTPREDMVSMETSDGSDHCQCPACRKLGSISDRAFGLANEVARVVAKELPGKMIGMLAYNDHCEPPSFSLAPNVYVQSTAGFIRGRYTFEELMRLWPTVCRDMGFYEYFSVWLWDFDMPPGGDAASLAHVRRRIRQYAEIGATSVDCESGNNWGLHGRGYYLANRLMWDPDADVDVLLADFYEKAFGPAAAVMKRYYERLGSDSRPLVSEHLLATALRDLAEASRLARDCPPVLARLGQLKQYLHYVRLRWGYQQAAEKDAKRDLARAVFTHVCRNRYTYMDHWAAIRHQWLRAAAKEYDLPTWLSDPPWKDAPPNTPAETDRQFRADMERFKPDPVEQVGFSNDLVPSGLSAKDPAASSQKYQKPARYALFSRRGEPLEVRITTGLIAWYRDRPDARYVVTDRAGKQVARGRLPQDGNTHDVKVEVPAGGLYRLEFDDQAAGWGIDAAAGRAVALVLDRHTQPSHLGQMQRMYFYVPKGTRRIRYFWQGRPHEVRAPDGSVAARVTESGRFVAVDVPEGADGKPWSLTRLAPGRLWFFNVPNVLAASPDALLVPRNLAERDGLAASGNAR